MRGLTDNSKPRLAPGRLAGKRLLLGAMALSAFLTPLEADEPPPLRKDFRGTWAGEAHCRWSEDFMLVYDRTTVDLPDRNAKEPGLYCRILQVSGKRPEWKLRLSCKSRDSQAPNRKRFVLHQTLKMAPNGFEMVVETEPYLGLPARREEVRFCRGANEPQPPLICFDNDKGHTVPCVP